MLIESTVAVFVTWVVMAATLAGIGSLVVSRFSEEYLLMDTVWMGLGVAVGVLENWSLVRPVTWLATALLLCAGIFGLIRNRSALFTRMATEVRAAGWWTLIPFAVVLFLAVRACGPCDHYDTGLYGAQAVRWAMTYPTVPGLANLHGRLGFNSSVFLCVAGLNQGVWKGLAHHLFTGFVMAAMCLTLLPAVFRAGWKRPIAASDWFHCILLIPVVFWVTRSKIVGTQTDEPAAIAGFVAAGILFDTLCLKDGEDEQRPGCARLILAATLLSLAVAFKESTIVFALLAWCLAFGWIWRMERSKVKRRKYVVGTLALSMVILLPWCARGIVLSGYPFFPATVLGIPTDWKIPAEEAHWYAAGVRSWGRNPDANFIADTQGLAWFSGWLNRAVRDRASFQIPLGISLSGLAVALGLRLGKMRVPIGPWLWLLVPSLAGIVFWFCASPDVRFAQFAIWTTAATLGTWGIVSFTTEAGQGRVWVIVAGLVASMAWCLISFGWGPPYHALVTSEPLSALQKVEYTARQTLSGLTVYLPAKDNRCWNGPLPCTALFDETLHLRKGQSTRWGFASNASPEFVQRLWAVPIR